MWDGSTSMRQLFTAALMIGLALLATATASSLLQQWALRQRESRTIEYEPPPIEPTQPFRRGGSMGAGGSGGGPPPGGAATGGSATGSPQKPSPGLQQRAPRPGGIDPREEAGDQRSRQTQGAEYTPPPPEAPSFRLGSPYRNDKPKAQQQQQMRPSTPTLRPASAPPERRI